MRKPKLGIIGVGMVGGALAKVLPQSLLYDKYKKLGSIKEINQADIIFICLPTPYNWQRGSRALKALSARRPSEPIYTKYNKKKGFDLSYIKEAFKIIKGRKIIVIKSTILPGTTEMLQKKHLQHKILFNPEFLTEESADQDMKYPDRQIMGYTKKSYHVARDILQLLPLAPFERIVPATEAEMAKYFGNCWFAVKVVYANQMYDLCQKLGIDYNRVMECAAADKRIGRSHLEIFHKGYRGYGGKCLGGQEFLYLPNGQGLSIDKIKNFRGGQVLTCGSGVKPDPVIAFSKRKIDKVIEIKLSKGRKLKVSPDHLMITYDEKGEKKIKTAKDLSLKDKIPVVLGKHIPQTQKEYQINLVDLIRNRKDIKIFINNYQYNERLKPYLSFHQYQSLRRARNHTTPLDAYLRAGFPLEKMRIKTGKTGTWVPAIIEIDKDFARLIGYYLAEGHTCERRVVFTLGFHERTIIKDIKDILELKNIQYSQRIAYWQGHKSSFVIKISSPILAELFSQFGKDCYSKRIPGFIFSSSDEIKDNLLIGLFRGDGWLEKSNMGNYYTIGYATVSPTLREGIDLLLREKGVLASFMEMKGKKAKVKSYWLQVSMREGIEKIGKFLTKDKQKKIFSVSSRKIASPAYKLFSKNLALLNIKMIKLLHQPQFVYALENSSHSYITSGGILTHNCLPKDIRALIQHGDKLGVDLKLLKTTEEINKILAEGKDR